MLVITFQPTGANAALTIVDDGAAELPIHRGKIETWPMESLVQIEEAYGGASKVQFPRGNIAGQVVFTDDCSYATYALMGAALKAAYALLNSQGALIITIGGAAPVGTAFNMAGAILKAVAPVLINGVQLILRYTFQITTIT